jgi:hypothetical protein
VQRRRDLGVDLVVACETQRVATVPRMTVSTVPICATSTTRGGTIRIVRSQALQHPSRIFPSRRHSGPARPPTGSARRQASLSRRRASGPSRGRRRSRGSRTR